VRDQRLELAGVYQSLYGHGHFAAERDSRLSELTADRPKGLVDVGRLPLLAHVFEKPINTGIDELPVVTCI
jgi:NDP-sugar pyrophosphorylase family protein